MSAHTHGVQGTKASSYKLLDHGDVIQCGDEVLADDTVNWLPLVGWEVGMKWGCNFMPMRRPAGVVSGGDTGPFLGPDEVCAPHGNVLPCEACFADGVSASGPHPLPAQANDGGEQP